MRDDDYDKNYHTIISVVILNVKYSILRSAATGSLEQPHRHHRSLLPLFSASALAQHHRTGTSKAPPRRAKCPSLYKASPPLLQPAASHPPTHATVHAFRNQFPAGLSTSPSHSLSLSTTRLARRFGTSAAAAAGWFGHERGYPCGADHKRPLRIHGRPPHLRLLPLASYTWRP
jgi:hypothetical protein